MPTSPPLIHRLWLPLLGHIALVRNAGCAQSAGTVLLGTHLWARVWRAGTLVDERDLGSGTITCDLVNALIADAVAGTSVVPTLARYCYQALGIGTTVSTDGDTDLQSEVGPTPRARAVLTQGQTCTPGNHAGVLTYTGRTTVMAPLAIQEWGLFDNPTPGTGHLLDRAQFAPINLALGDAYEGILEVTLASGG